MQMVKRDETPPGIQQVENRLSRDTGHLPVSQHSPPLKPWQTSNGNYIGSEGHVNGNSDSKVGTAYHQDEEEGKTPS